MADPGARPILPQSNAPLTHIGPDRREKQTNYVFVDEHNRSRRLKVMRACESCRRRKIKCDAASTNVWPCTACLKQKIPCAPPSLNAEKDEANDPANPNQQTFKVEQGATPDSHLDFNSYQSFDHNPSVVTPPWKHTDSFYAGHDPFNHPSGSDPGSGFDRHAQFGSIDSSVTPGRTPLNPQQSYDTVSVRSDMSPPQSVGWRSDFEDTNISEALGDLKISSVAVAPYITNQRNLADSAAVHEAESPVPLTYGPDNKIIIPPEMMPSEKQARVYFEYFFKNIHPYVPVLSRSLFFQKWQSDRQSISPLILEAIFACSAMLMQHTTEGSRWLSLASRHEDSFGDVPRLSTLQGLIILLKARETVPKRGYYYRSWMTIVKLVAMAKDLELDQHLELHQAGKDCGSSGHAECAAKTRVWQSCFIVELMVGGAQGRTDFSVNVDTVDLKVPQPPPGFEDPEFRISQQFTEFTIIAQNVRRSNQLYAQLRNKNDNWALDENFVRHNQDFNDWLQSLPSNLQVTFPTDSSTPWIPSHFVGNLHCYYYLAILMHHRPQLHSSDPMNESWREQFLICHSAATRICLLQEAVLQQYGLDGLLWMIRGVNFAIYCILTSIVLHLVALTSPDPFVSYDAADYFARHMRILERLSSSWPMPQMQAQILSLRQAFSADITKPFELRQDITYGSRHTSPLSDSGSAKPIGDSFAPTNNSSYQTGHGRSTGALEDMMGSRAHDTSMHMMHQGVEFGTGSDTQFNASHPTEYWNPTKIFDSWNVAFGQTAQDDSQSPTQPTRMPFHRVNSSGSSPPQFTQNVTNVTNVQFNNIGTATPDGSLPAWPRYNAQPSNTPQLPSFFPQQQGQPTASLPVEQNPSRNYDAVPVHPTSITPNMWQDAVASSYATGSKRRFNDSGGDAMTMGNYKRTR